jgi:hypothetical protein
MLNYFKDGPVTAVVTTQTSLGVGEVLILPVACSNSTMSISGSIPYHIFLSFH